MSAACTDSVHVIDVDIGLRFFARECDCIGTDSEPDIGIDDFFHCRLRIVLEAELADGFERVLYLDFLSGYEQLIVGI